MLISNIGKTKWNGKTKKYYIEKGYKFTKMGDDFDVQLKDLSENSSVLVEVKCDCKDCENPYLNPMPWGDYRRCLKEDAKFYCKKCACNLYGNENMRKTRLLNGKSFEQWCIENNRLDILDRWDYVLNKCKPSEISYSSCKLNKKGYWFKCSKHPEHKSELKSINSFTHGRTGSLDCNQCNSFAQWGIDNICEDFLEKYWDFEKNIKIGINPWEIARGNSKIKVWIKCQDISYHESYDIVCNHFTNNERCPYCHGSKTHYLDSMGILLENKELSDLWSEKNNNSPYECMPNSNKIKAWWKCAEKKHEDFYRDMNHSLICNFRCPECVQERDESMIQEKTRLYLEDLGYDVLHEKNCTLSPKNIISPPNGGNLKRRNKKLRYDNEIIINNNLHIFIEVMGSQHEKISEWGMKSSMIFNTTPQQELDYQIAKDKYKEQYVYEQGENYYYLALWYYDFNKKDKYKMLINNKIDDIYINNINLITS